MSDKSVSQLLMMCALMLSLVLNIHYLLFYSFNPWGIDFRVFWQAASSDPAGIYISGDAPFVYPPTAIVFFKPLALLDFFDGFLFWTILSAGLFAIAVTKNAGWRVALLSFLSAAALQGLALGQTPMILSAALLLAITAPGFACGVIFGMVGAIKPQLMMLAPLAFLVRKDWGALAGMAAGLLVSVAVELALYGPQLWLDWLNSIPNFRQSLFRTDVMDKVITPYGVADHLGVSPIPFLAVSAALATAAVIVSARRVEGIYLVAVIVGASILASPYALRHDTIALIPAAIVFILAQPKLKVLPAMGIFSGYLACLSLIVAALQLLTGGKLERDGKTGLAPAP